jgi:hypothetical protein
MLIGPPKNNLFLITSCIKTNIGHYNAQERFNQTVETIESIRGKCPNSIIFIADNSSSPLDDKIYGFLSSKCDFVANVSGDKNAKNFNDAGLKSAGDAYLLMKMIELLLGHPNAMKLVSGSNRIFKISGRYKLNNSFNIDDYNQFGKFVVRKHDTWRDDKSIPGLYITRLLSFCPSLLKYAHPLLDRVIRTVMNPTIDFEHALYQQLDKTLAYEIDKLGVEGNVAPNGQLHID